MNLRQLTHVTALAKHRNFGRAADALGLTQPALTQSIAKLEAELGVALFERYKRDIVLTPFGQTTLHLAQRVHDLVASHRLEIDAIKNMRSRRLVIGCEAWFAKPLIAPALASMLKVYPDLRFSLRIGSIRSLMDGLLAGDVDLVVGTRQNVSDSRLTWHALTLPALVPVCRVGHPILALERPTAHDCLSYPMATPIFSQWYIEWLDRQLGQPVTDDGRDVTSYTVESDDMGVIVQLVLSSDVITSLLPDLVDDHIDRGLLAVIPINELDFPVEAVIGYPSYRPLPPAGDLFVRTLQDRF